MGSGTIITNADEGKTITLAKGAVAYLQLGTQLRWGDPTVTGNAVTVSPAGAADPATGSKWTIAAVATGQATIRDSGGPICPTGPMIACPMFIEEFFVTIDVV